MTISTILAKILKGEALTDEEKAFVGAYDPQKEIDTASAYARRKAEERMKEAIAKQTAAENALRELQEKAADPAKDNELAALQKKVAKLEALNAAAEAKNAAHARRDAIRAAAKANGVIAAEGINADVFERLLDLTVGETDINDEDALKGALESFKKDNPAMIAASVRSGSGQLGNPRGGESFSGKNPWKTESLNLTEQMRMVKDHPEQAVALAADAGVKLDLNTGSNPSLG